MCFGYTLSLHLQCLQGTLKLWTKFHEDWMIGLSTKMIGLSTKIAVACIAGGIIHTLVFMGGIWLLPILLPATPLVFMAPPPKLCLAREKFCQLRKLRWQVTGATPNLFMQLGTKKLGRCMYNVISSKEIYNVGQYHFSPFLVHLFVCLFAFTHLWNSFLILIKGAIFCFIPFSQPLQ